jgi:hypothetical protein
MKMPLIVVLALAMLAACQDQTNSANATTEPTAPVTGVPARPDTGTVDTASISGDKLIVAGKQIGHIVLGLLSDSLQPMLGKPDRSDAGMGKAWLSWYGKTRDEHNNRISLDIYTTYADSTMKKRTVQQVRTTSTEYATARGIKVYNDLATIKAQYPNVAFAGRYKELNNDRVFSLYDDTASGIAFEIVEANQQQICIGILVHPANKKVMEISPLLTDKK